MCGIIGYVGSRPREESPARRPRAARVPRLRLGRARPPRGRRPRIRPRGRQPRPAQGGGRPRRLRRDHRGRAHALGHARQGLRRERASADRLHRGRGRDRPQRDRRELPRAQGALVEDGHAFTSETDAEVVAHLVERHYNGRPRRGRPAGVRRARGPLRVRRHPPRPPGAARRRRLQCPLVVGIGDGEMFLASSIAAFLRESQRVQLIEDGEVVAITTEGATFFSVEDGRASARSSRSTGTTRPPRSTATRPSCSRRSTSSRRRSPRRSATASAAAGLELETSA